MPPLRRRFSACSRPEYEPAQIALQQHDQIGANEQRLDHQPSLTAHRRCSPHPPDHPQDEYEGVEAQELEPERRTAAGKEVADLVPVGGHEFVVKVGHFVELSRAKPCLI